MIKCPECGGLSEKEDWEESEVGCEDCGSHPSRECPICYEHIDLIFHTLEEYEINKKSPNAE